LLLDTVMSIQPRIATASNGKSSEDVVLELMADIQVCSIEFSLFTRRVVVKDRCGRYVV
jgi:hypothetical protein